MLKESSKTVFPLCAKNVVCIRWFTSFITYYPHFIDEVIVVQRSSTSEKLSSYFRMLVKRKAQFKPRVSLQSSTLFPVSLAVGNDKEGGTWACYTSAEVGEHSGERKKKKKHKNFLRTPKYPFHKMQKSRKEWNDWISIKPYCDALFCKEKKEISLGKEDRFYSSCTQKAMKSFKCVIDITFWDIYSE